MNQVELAKAVKNRGGSLSQGQISSLEAGTVGRPRSLPELAAALRTTVEWLLSDDDSAAPPQQDRHNNATVHSQNGRSIITAAEPLIVWRSVPSTGRAGETLIYKEKAGVATRPVEMEFSKDAFAIKVVDDEAHPRYERRDTLLLDPGTTPAEGDDCFFVRNRTETPMSGMARRLVRITPEHWVVRRFEPGSRDQKLDRSEWQSAFHIFGSYNRR
jgi:phage repressor protein C with HTH and peptisase S24 domain